MKRQLLRYLPATIAAIALFINANGQLSEPGPKLQPKGFIYDEGAANLPEGNRNYIPGINARAIKDFSKNFKTAQDVSWYVLKDGFSVQCKLNGITTRNYYDLKGRWTGTVRTYEQNKLPAELRKEVRSIYYDYSIYIVNEVTVGDTTAYLVGIQDEENIKTIRVIDGEMDVYEDFKKMKIQAP